MEVSVKNVSVERSPLTYLGKIAGTCTGKEEEGNPYKRALSCLSNGHMSVFEHINITWDVSGVSRALTHQLVRHRIASFTQQSQRYVKMKINPESTDWYVTPFAIEHGGNSLPDFDDDYMHIKELFEEHMENAALLYAGMLEVGIPAEDARYALPNAMKTNIVVTMNLREFMHFYKMRADKHAQWEIRELAELMLGKLAVQTSNDEEWVKLTDMILLGDI